MTNSIFYGQMEVFNPIYFQFVSSTQINGVVLHKMCHLNASVLIKGIPGSTLEFLVLRKDTALAALAVKAVTNFPVAFDQLDQLHSCYKNVRTVSIQKVRATHID